MAGGAPGGLILLAAAAAAVFGQDWRAKEQALGRQLAFEIERSTPVLHDAPAEEYLNRLARRLATACEADPEVDVRLLAADQRNAFAIPGGHLYLNTGLIRASASEAQLAAVLSWLIEQDWVRGLGRPASGGGAVPMVFMGGTYGYSWAPVQGMAIPLGFVDAYRATVAAADERAPRCLRRAGYDPETFIESLQSIPEAAETGSLKSTHPPASERIEHVREVISSLEPNPADVIDTRDFAELKRRMPPESRNRAAAAPSLKR